MSVVDMPYFAASTVLVLMGFVSLITCWRLRSRTRALEKYRKNISVGFFKRTFNIFSPFPDRRRVLNANLPLVALIALYGAFLGSGFFTMKIFEFGFLLAFIVLLICLGFLLIDETLELHKTAGVFVNALSKNSLLGEGDVEVLDFLRPALLKLSRYHLTIAVVFLAGSLVLPLVVDTFLLTFSRFAALLFAAAAALWFFPPLVVLFVALIFALTVLVVQLGANKVKTRILDLPSTLGAIDGTYSRMRSGRYFSQVVWSLHHPKQRYVPDDKHLEEEETESDRS